MYITVGNLCDTVFYICFIYVYKDKSNIVICFINVKIKNQQPILIIHEASLLLCLPPSSQVTTILNFVLV